MIPLNTCTGIHLKHFSVNGVKGLWSSEAKYYQLSKIRITVHIGYFLK
jgi:hypothetical protein